jgi:hypothetical protein
LRESCHHAKHKKQNPDFLYIVHSCISFLIFVWPQNCHFSFRAAIGRKSYIQIKKIHLYVRATVEKQKFMKSQSHKPFHCVIAVMGVAFLLLGSTAVLAQQAESQVMTTTKEAPKIPNDQLDSLVAPIALYPDQLLSQTLVASTYPLEIIQLQQWMEKNKNLKDKALASAVQKENWDPSIQAMAAFPDVVNRMADNIQWTTDLGNAFLAQESDVMDAVQGMRGKAQSKGTLKTTQQQKVETQTVQGGKQVIVVQQASPDVVYVPSYDPAVVYGPPVYPYPPIYYPPPGYYAAGAAIAFGTGVALGAAWGGSWGWNCGWGHGDVNVNVNNNYINNYNKNNFNKQNFNKQSGTWQHNPQHRGGAPYNRASASQVQNQLGSRERGAGAGNRQGGGAGAGNRPGGGAGTRPGGGGAGAGLGGGGAGAGPGGGGAGARPSTRPSGGSATNQIGNRSASSRPSASRGGGFGGGSGNYARASSNRGGQSMGGGGFSRGGGGGGGFHGGGGGRGGGGGGRR